MPRAPIPTQPVRRACRSLRTLGLVVSLWALATCTADEDHLAPASQTAKLVINPDGDLSITTAGQVVNRYSPLTVAALAGDTAVTVQSLATLGVSTDDLVMIIQMQGAQIQTSDDEQYGTVQNLQGAGLYELVRVRGVDVAGSRVLLDTRCGGLRSAYSVQGHAQVVRVPQVGNVTIAPGASVVAPAWDGQRGGVVALRASGVITVNGAIDVSGQGFRGGLGQSGLTIQTDESPDRSGYRTTQLSLGAAKGESIAGSAVEYAMLSGGFGRGAPANGGGGGNGVKSGGGGGANRGILTSYDGHGVMDPNAIGKAAWSLDPATISLGKLRTSSGGGRGGYSGSSSDQDALTSGPGTAAWGSNQRRERGGRGGHPIPTSPEPRLFFGGGGGGGDSSGKTAAPGTPGGSGGGLVFLWGSRLTGSGRISSLGLPGGSTTGPSHDQAAGGGGGGGTLALLLPVVEGTLKLQAGGGLGGNHGAGVANDAAGPGGGGGGGLLILPKTLPILVVHDSPGGAAGTSLATAVSEFPVNGATRGGDGEEQVFVPGSLLPACLPTDLAVTVTSTKKSAVPGTTFLLTVTVTNIGSELAVGTPLASVIGPGAFPSVNWTCTATPSAAGEVASCSASRGFQDLSSTVSLSPGQKAVYEVAIAVPSAAIGSLSYQATVAAPSGSIDGDLSNNQASLVTPIQPSADLQVLITPAPTPAAPSQPVTVVVSARNMGPSDGREVELRFAVPDGFRVVRAPSSEHLVCSGGPDGYTCRESQLGRFTTHDVLLVVEPLESASELRFSAEVSGAVADDVPANNRATVVVPYDPSLPPYRPAQLGGGGFGCALTAHTVPPSTTHPVSALVLLATALRFLRRLRGSRPSRHG